MAYVQGTEHMLDIQERRKTVCKELISTLQESIRMNLVSVFISHYAQRKPISDYNSIDEERLFLAFVSPQSSTSIVVRGMKEKKRKETMSTKLHGGLN